MKEAVERAKEKLLRASYDERKLVTGLLIEQPTYLEPRMPYDQLVDKGLVDRRLREIRSNVLGIVDYPFYEVPPAIAQALRELHGEA